MPAFNQYLKKKKKKKKDAILGTKEDDEEKDAASQYGTSYDRRQMDELPGSEENWGKKTRRI